MTPTSYSARVDMQLLLPGGIALPVTQSGPDFLILAEPAACGPADAVLAVTIDGTLSHYPCPLPQGIRGKVIRLEPAVVPVAG